MIDVLTEELRAPIPEEAAELYVGGTVFKTGPPAGVGVELEWLVHDADDSDLPVRPGRLAQALAEEFDPPLAGRLTTQPGGQLELSSPPAPLAGCLPGTTADLDRLRRRVAAHGLALAAHGLALAAHALDPRPPVLAADTPRRVRAGLPAVAAEVRDFGERCPERGRCPADDLIEREERA